MNGFGQSLSFDLEDGKMVVTTAAAARSTLEVCRVFRIERGGQVIDFGYEMFVCVGHRGGILARKA